MEFKRSIVAQFQRQDCELTLREALEEFYAVNAHLFAKPEPKTPWTNLLVHHDVSHVFFGVNTSLMDESAGDLWTIFGTSMTMRDYFAYVKTPEAKKLLKDIGFSNLVKALFCSIPLVFKIYKRAAKMSRKWDYDHYDAFMDLPLKEVRDSFHLEILP